MLRYLIVSAFVLCLGCQTKHPQKTADSAAHSKDPATVAFELTGDVKRFTDFKKRDSITLTEPKRYEDCHVIFEPEHQPLVSFPVAEPQEKALTLSGCSPEAELQTAEREYYAYSVGPSETTDLRVVAYQRSDRKLLWSHRIDRSKQGANFIANFRGSFVTEVAGNIVCAGTLWEGGTQTTCVDSETGKPHWQGQIPVWSGIKPVGGERGLFVADLTSLTKRYPFSGVEMRFRKLDGLGGRAGVYLNDNKALYFSPNRSDEPRLLKYDFAAMQAVWKLKLPESATPNFGLVLSDEERVVFKTGDVLRAVDTTSGKLKWSYNVGADHPSMVEHQGTLYIVHRRPADMNILVALNPVSGSVNWWTELPSGILSVSARDQTLVLKSVRAVRTVINL